MRTTPITTTPATGGDTHPLPNGYRSSPSDQRASSPLAMRRVYQPASVGHAESFTPPQVLKMRDLPGPMSLHRLTGLGVVRRLDEAHAYYARYTTTVQGRVRMVKRLAPSHVIVCALTACWVWLGGELPQTVDVVSQSHFRTVMYGRKIRVFNKQTTEQDVTTICGLHITTPLRTACEIAVLPNTEWEMADGASLVCALMNEYRLTKSDCMAVLNANRFWSNGPRAKRFFSTLLEIEDRG